MKTIFTRSAFAFFLLINISCNQILEKRMQLIVAGSFAKVASETIPVQGGTISVSQPGQSINGFTIDIPANSFEIPCQFQISHAEITDADLPAGLEAVSPLIEVDNGGVYSKETMALSFPVKKSRDEVVMGFIYDEESGGLEALPLISQDENRVVVGTRHFTKIIFAKGAADEKILNKKYETGFTPGVDDWQMGNPGSVYYSVGGQCSGQSTAMMWYYLERMKNKKLPPLNGMWDNDGKDKTPEFWRDDVKALKLCAMIQGEDFDLRFTYEEAKKPKEEFTDRQTMILFAYAFHGKENPEPQFLKVSNAQGSHALVVYKMEEGNLYIADPNIPGSRVVDGARPGINRVIRYNKATQDYEDYTSGKTVYTNFTFMGSSALVPFSKVANYWKQAEGGTIADNVYPRYTLAVLDKEGNAMPASSLYEAEDGILRLGLEAKSDKFSFVAFDRSGQMIKLSDALAEGMHKVGIQAIFDGKWVGFHWLNVEVKKKTTKDPPLFGYTAVELTIDGRKVGNHDNFFVISPTENKFIMNMDGAYGGLKTLTTIQTDEWKGEGEHRADGSWIIEISSTGGVYESAKKGARLNIFKWRDGQIEGEFSFEAVDERGDKKVVKGTFMDRRN